MPNPVPAADPGLPAVDWGVLRDVLSAALAALGDTPAACDAAALKESMRLQRLAAHVSSGTLASLTRKK